MAWVDLPPNIRNALAAVCTDRELRVLKAAAAGMTYRAIADQEKITPEAVRKRIERAYHKAKHHPDWSST